MTTPRPATLFPFSDRSLELQAKVAAFVAEKIIPAEAEFAAHDADPATRWTPVPRMAALKAEAKAAGLWNLFLPDARLGAGLSNLDYAPIAELTGRSLHAPEAFNCSAPDTGNMEVLAHFASPGQQAPWLPRLLAGEIRSAFAMTEPDVASSDATNIAMPIVRDGDEFVINGRKWWTTGAGHPHCEILIVMGVTDAPHGHVEMAFDNVRVPVANLLRESGSGFEIAQARLGPGRIHHCMRLIGMAQRALEMMVERARHREAFGRPLGGHGMAQEAIALSRCEIEQARLLTLQAAAALDAHGNKGAKDLIGMIKIVAPRMACAVVDRAMQVHGGGGLSQDHFLAQAYAGARSLRLADGPDEVHIAALARSMLKA